jgi:hypothetical protein
MWTFRVLLQSPRAKRELLMKWKRFLAAAALLAIGTRAASADSIAGYTNQITQYQVITAGEPASVATQIKTYLKDNGNNTVSFHFENLGSFTDSITEIYFQDGAWLGVPISAISSSSSVIWSPTATPDQLPGGTNATPPFQTDISLNSQATQQGGQQSNGINNNASSPYVQADWLTLTFNYVSGTTFADVLAGRNATNPADRLEIGFHVTGYASSASVVTWGTTPGVTNEPPGAPLPSTALVGMGLLVGVGAIKAKRSGNRGQVA